MVARRTYLEWVKLRLWIAGLVPDVPVNQLGSATIEVEFPVVSQLIQAVVVQPLQIGAGEDAAAALVRVLGESAIFVKDGNTADVWRTKDAAQYRKLFESLCLSLINKYEAAAPLTQGEAAMAPHLREAASKDLIKSWVNQRLPAELVMSNFVKDWVDGSRFLALLSHYGIFEAAPPRAPTAVTCSPTPMPFPQERTAALRGQSSLVSALSLLEGLCVPMMVDEALLLGESKARKDCIFAYLSTLRLTLGSAEAVFKNLGPAEGEGVSLGSFIRAMGKTKTIHLCRGNPTLLPSNQVFQEIKQSQTKEKTLQMDLDAAAERETAQEAERRRREAERASVEARRQEEEEAQDAARAEAEQRSRSQSEALMAAAALEAALEGGATAVQALLRGRQARKEVSVEKSEVAMAAAAEDQMRFAMQAEEQEHVSSSQIQGPDSTALQCALLTPPPTLQAISKGGKREKKSRLPWKRPRRQGRFSNGGDPTLWLLT